MANIFLDALQETKTSDNPFLASLEQPTNNDEPESPSAETQDSEWKSAGRTALQAPLGVAKRFTWQADLAKALAQGISTDELLQERREALNQGEEFDIEGAEKAAENLFQYFPNQDLAEEFIEKHTGLPLRPQNKTQQLVRLGSEAATFKPGGVVSKGAAFATAPAISAGLQQAGAPEGVSDLVGLILSQIRFGGKSAKDIESLLLKGESGGAGPDLPKSTFQTAEKALKELTGAETQTVQAAKPSFTSTAVSQEGQKALKQTQIASGSQIGNAQKLDIEPLGLKPTTPSPAPTITDEVGNIFSKDRFYNTTLGGKAIKNQVMAADNADYEAINNKYKQSRELNSNIEDIHPQLVENLNADLVRLKKIPSPSRPEKELIYTLEDITKRLATTENVLDEAGNIIGKKVTGYQPISNQVLIDQIQSLRKKIDYDFSHGDVRGIFKPTINNIQETVLETAVKSGNEAAATSFNEARQLYKSWVDTFDSDYVRPLRDRSNKDYSKLFQRAQDLDEFNVLKDILNKSPEGKVLEDALRRELIEKRLDKYLKNPSKTASPEFTREMRELEAVATPEQIKQLEADFKRHRDIGFKARDIGKTREVEAATKYLGKNKTPEDVQRLLDSRSGLRELRQDLSKTANGKELFDTLSRQKMRSILREGNIERNFKGKDLYNVLNKEQNFEIFSEIIGEDATEAARLAAKDLGAKQMTKDAVKDLTKKKLILKFLGIVVDVL